MSPGEYLRFVGLMEGLSGRESAHRTLELLEFFDLETKRRDPISTLSTGMKKKVSLAAAIIHRPRLVVLDEPLEGIDALAASTVKETLSMMAARGATIFITSHVLDTIERFCSEVAVIDRGKVVLQCKTSEIRTRGKGKLSSGSFSSLEELFVELVSTKVRKRSLSYM
jgi:ABC-2 type transport system ATP-binding protein